VCFCHVWAKVSLRWISFRNTVPKVFSHMRWTLDGYSALVIGLLYLRWTRLFRVQRTCTQQKKNCHAHALWICHTLHALVLFCYAMRNFIRFSGLRVMSSTLFFNVPPPAHMFFYLRPDANFALVLPVCSQILRLQASTRCIYCTSCSLWSQNTPHLRQNARGGVYKKRMEPV
jgi:hypothetical protein